MKQSQKIFLYSLSSLAMLSSSVVYADQMVTAPTLEGGITASIGTFLATPSSDFETYSHAAFQNRLDVIEAQDIIPIISGASSVTAFDVDPDSTFGIEASLGYIFEETANGIELTYRNLNTSDKADDFSETGGKGYNVCEKTMDNCSINAHGDLGYELNSGDLLISQFINIGDNMQMRLVGGLAYVELEWDLKSNSTITDTVTSEIVETFSSEEKSEFTGWGPRVGTDVRYDFGQGFGIVGGGSLAYYLGEMNMNASEVSHISQNTAGTFENELNSHSVVNLRGNLGVDYVYFFDNDEGSTIGLELGYLVDFYDDAIGTWVGSSTSGILDPETTSVTFSGPYVNLKGVW